MAEEFRIESSRAVVVGVSVALVLLMSLFGAITGYLFTGIAIGVGMAIGMAFRQLSRPNGSSADQ